MQISRHWRLNSQRYRLQGTRYENGQVSLQARPICKDERRNDVELRVIEGGKRQERRLEAAR